MHITSAALAVSGIILIIGAFIKGIYARHTAEKWIHVMEFPSVLVFKDEFALVDDFRIISFFAILIGASLMGLAKIGCMASWKKNVEFTNVSYKRSLVRVTFVMFLALIVRYYTLDAKAIYSARITKKAQVDYAKFKKEMNQTESKF